MHRPVYFRPVCCHSWLKTCGETKTWRKSKRRWRSSSISALLAACRGSPWTGRSLPHRSDASDLSNKSSLFLGVSLRLQQASGVEGSCCNAFTMYAARFPVAGLGGCCGEGAGLATAQSLEQRLHICKGHILGCLQTRGKDGMSAFLSTCAAKQARISQRFRRKRPR